MIIKQSIYVLCAIGFLCATSDLAMAQPKSVGGSKTGGKVFPTVKAGPARDGHETSGEVRKPYGVVKRNQGSQEKSGVEGCWHLGIRVRCRP